MVGYRNELLMFLNEPDDFIRHSDGGVSERVGSNTAQNLGLYQAFRWWGIGTPKYWT